MASDRAAAGRLTAVGELPRIETERLILRPYQSADASALARLLADPAVRRWWPSPIDEPSLDDEFAGQWTILRGDQVVGILEAWEEDDPNYPSVALDIALAADCHGRGLGPEALRAAIAHFVSKGHHRFSIDPNAKNARAIAAYAKVGFKPVGIARQAEIQLDGSRQDSLMMDLLSDEVE